MGDSMSNIPELAQLRADLSNLAIGSKDHMRKLALSLVEELEKTQRAAQPRSPRVRLPGRSENASTARILR